MGIQTRIKSSCKSTCLNLVAEFALGALSRKSTLQVPGEKKKLVVSLGCHHVYNVPERLFLGEQLLPLLVDFTLYLELNFTELDDKVVSFN